MVWNRWPINQEGDASVLGEELKLPTSKKVVKNRLLKPPVTEGFSTYDAKHPLKSGIPTQKTVNVYEKWGLGGFGMLITGNIFVDPKHMEWEGNSLIHPSIHTTERKNEFKRCASALKNGGGLGLAQLNHAGRLTPIRFNDCPWAPSSVQHQSKISFLGKYGVPKELSRDDIQNEIIPNFVYAAKYCYEAGFDGIQIHAALGYLLSEFLTTNTNKRTDEYGGSIENRARIIKEIYQAIRKEVPEGFVIGIKINTHEFGNMEFSSDDVVKFCQEFDKYGFDFIELSGGSVEEVILNYDKMRESTKTREAFFQEYSKQIKPVVEHARLYLTGGLRTVYGMTDVINSGVADGVGIGRPSMAEPDIAKKILSKQVQSVAYNALEASHIFYSSSSAAMLAEAASTSVEEANGDPMYGISDYSCSIKANYFKVTFILKMIPTMIKKSIFG